VLLGVTGGFAKAAEAMATNITAMSTATVANNKMRFFMRCLLNEGWDSVSPAQLIDVA
jgi:hypothetical protein